MTATAVSPPMKDPAFRRRMDEPLRVRRALVALPAVAVVIASLLAGLGGVASAASGAGGSSPSPSGIRLTSATPLQTCLKAHGVKLPKGFDFSKKFKPSGNFKPSKNFKPPKGFNPSKNFKPSKLSKKLEAALKACGVKGGFFFGGSSSNAARASALKAYLSCLSDNGVKVPKKDEKDGAFIGLSSQKKFASANKKCSVLLPTAPTTTGS